MIPVLIELVAAASLLVADARFEVQTIDGQSAAGQIAAFDGQELVLESDGGRLTFPLGKLATVARAGAAPSQVPANLWVELVDGSGLPVAEYTAAEGKATLRLSGDKTLEVPTDRIRFVRFGPQTGGDAKLARQWSEIVETKAAGDLVVVRQKDSLDYLEGVLRSVDADVCLFEIDGEAARVKRPKVEGLVYAHPREAELPATIGKLTAADGARLALAKVALADGKFQLTTPAGTSHELAIDAVTRFDFSSGKIAYLSDLEPETAEFTPLLGFKNPSPGLLAFYAYRRDVSFGKNPLRLDGKEFRKGLALASRTHLVYKLPDRFRLFRATVGIDDSTRDTGSVRAEIKGDGKTLWQADVRGSEPAQQIELDISGVRRLEIVADYGENLDVGDRLDLGEAQVTK
jgi:hypothetical protein